MARKIVVFPHPVLRRKSRKIGRLLKSDQKLIEDLETTLEKSHSGIGLSAPQIAVSRRVFAIRDSSFQVFINPEIIDTFGESKVYPITVDSEGKEEEFLEGCLSLPGLYGAVRRWLKIGVSWQEPGEGDSLVDKQAVLEGLLAIVFQHELDHLEGILFVDRVKEEGGRLYRVDKEGRRKEISVANLQLGKGER
jgi:peptide deformylase